MLTRRKFVKTAAAVGLGAALPLNIWDGYAASFQKPARTSVPDHSETADSCLMAVEAWEDLWDDLDCRELVAQYTTLGGIEVIGERAGHQRAKCPFDLIKAHEFLVDRNGYYCPDCDACGTTMEFYAKMEGLSNPEASPKLMHLLETKALRGRRSEHETLWAINDDAAQMYHQALTDASEGEPGRRWLEQEGIARDTIKWFSIGFAPGIRSYLSGHLAAKGYSNEQIGAAGLALLWPTRACTPTDRHQSAITIPVRDQHGHIWGFLFRYPWKDGVPSFRFDLESMRNLSPNRFRRLIYPMPTWPRDLSRDHRVLLAEDPLEVALLSQAGLHNAVWAGSADTDDDEMAFRLRTVSGLASRFVRVFQAEEAGGWLFEGLLQEMGANLNLLDLLVLPRGQSVRDVLRTKGPAALRERLAQPVAIRDALAI